MDLQKVVKIIVGLGVVLILLNFFKDLFFDDDAYQIQIWKERKQKNEAFRRSNDSPFEGEDLKKFDSLRYFEVDKDLRIAASLKVYEEQDTFMMQMSGGEAEPYLQFGKAVFSIDQQEASLILFKKAFSDENKLFIPFADMTNGNGTYDGGRYLDAELPEKGATSIVLDFNRAYNPYCVYNYDYKCPLPPRNNVIKAKIEAGEKMYIKK